MSSASPGTLRVLTALLLKNAADSDKKPAKELELWPSSLNVKKMLANRPPPAPVLPEKSGPVSKTELAAFLKQRGTSKPAPSTPKPNAGAVSKVEVAEFLKRRAAPNVPPAQSSARAAVDAILAKAKHEGGILADAAGRTADDFVGIGRAAGNAVGEGVRGAGKVLKETGDEVARVAKHEGGILADAAGRTADDIVGMGRAAGNAVGEGARAADKAVKETGRNVRRDAEAALDSLGGAVTRGAKAVGSGVSDAASEAARIAKHEGGILVDAYGRTVDDIAGMGRAAGNATLDAAKATGGAIASGVSTAGGAIADTARAGADAAYGLFDKSKKGPATPEEIAAATPKRPGLVDRYVKNLKGGDPTTLVGTGAAALLAGLLTQNLLKKRTRKHAADAGEPPSFFSGITEAPRRFGESMNFLGSLNDPSNPALMDAGGVEPGFLSSNWFGLGDQRNADTFSQEGARNFLHSMSGLKLPSGSVGSNYVSALGRGHTGTVLGTGAVAVLAGVLTHNLLKKRNKR